MFETESGQIYGEALLLMELEHKHLVKCLGCIREVCGKTDVPPMLVLEYCRDGTLADQLDMRKYPISQGFHWLHQAAMGMEYLHSKGVHHRDLKPCNILLHNGEAKIGDLNLFRMLPYEEGSERSQTETPAASVRGRPSSCQSKLSDADRASVEELDTALIPSKRDPTDMAGTPRYRAPENHELSHYPITLKTDVYSFGIVTYEVLARKRAFGRVIDAEWEEVEKAVVLKNTRPVLPSKWSDELRLMVKSIWAANPSKRPNFSDLAKAIGVMIQTAEEAGDDKGYGLFYGVE